MNDTTPARPDHACVLCPDPERARIPYRGLVDNACRSWGNGLIVDLRIQYERLTLDEVPVFSFVAGLALADAVQAAGASPTIKWPNDVLIDGRKMGGARIECSARETEVEHVIIGVGANLNVGLDDLVPALGPKAEATSLRAATGHEIDRNAFAADYLDALDKWVRRYREDGPAPILQAWRARDILTGRQVEIRDTGGVFVGRVAGVDRHGRLLVKDAVGERRTVTTEEIRPCD